MQAITISRLLNSGGKTIGQMVAEELQYHFVSKETIEKIMHQYGMVHFDQVYESAPGILDKLDSYQEDMIDFLRKVIQALAIHGRVVIIGRGSFAVFPNFSDVLNVRLWAPLEERVTLFMKEDAYSKRLSSLKEVEEKDKTRKAFVERWFHGHAEQSKAFDLVINTAKVPLETVASAIVETARSSSNLILEGHRSLKTLQVDPVLLMTVKEVLEQQRSSTL